LLKNPLLFNDRTIILNVVFYPLEAKKRPGKETSPGDEININAHQRRSTHAYTGWGLRN
jgi:hypothetical protein